MSQPFGFSAPDDDPDHRSGDGARGHGGPGSGGPGSGGFDPSQLGQMFTQLGQMFGSMGQDGPGGASGERGGAINFRLATTVAQQKLGRQETIGAGPTNAVTESVRLAELWLEDTTVFPAGISRVEAWTPAQWVEHSLPTWEALCTPLAEQMNSATRDSLPGEAAQFVGPLMSMFDQIGGMSFGVQLGQGLGDLAPAVLFSTEIGIPFGKDGVAALLPKAIEDFASELELPARDVMVFLAAREAAHLRLFAGAPWLRARLLATVDEYARGIRIDTSAMDELAGKLDPSVLSDPSKLQELFSSGPIGPKVVNVNEAALGRLETLLALVEGWVDVTVTAALGERLPSAAALRETWLRRRATGGSAEQAFSKVVGLELRPRLAREASEMWRRVGEAMGVDERDGLWSHPDLLPSGEDVTNPAGVIDRMLDDSGAGSVGDEVEDFLRGVDGGGSGDSDGGCGDGDGGSGNAAPEA